MQPAIGGMYIRIHTHTHIISHIYIYIYIYIHICIHVFCRNTRTNIFLKEINHKRTYPNRSFLAMPKRVATAAADIPGAKAPKCADSSATSSDAMGSAKKRLEELAKKAGLRDTQEIRSVVPCWSFFGCLSGDGNNRWEDNVYGFNGHPLQMEVFCWENHPQLGGFPSHVWTAMDDASQEYFALKTHCNNILKRNT